MSRFARSKFTGMTERIPVALIVFKIDALRSFSSARALLYGHTYGESGHVKGHLGEELSGTIRSGTRRMAPRRKLTLGEIQHSCGASG